MAHTLTGKAYDDAQTHALQVRDQYIEDIQGAIGDIIRKSGSPDPVEDALNGIIAAARAALRINKDLQANDLSRYDVSITTCPDCQRTHQRRHMCICKG